MTDELKILAQRDRLGDALADAERRLRELPPSEWDDYTEEIQEQAEHALISVLDEAGQYDPRGDSIEWRDSNGRYIFGCTPGELVDSGYEEMAARWRKKINGDAIMRSWRCVRPGLHVSDMRYENGVREVVIRSFADE